MNFAVSRRRLLAGLLVCTCAVHAAPVAAPAEEDFSVFEGSDVAVEGTAASAQAPPELGPLQRWIDSQRRLNDVGLIEGVPGAEVLVELAEAAPSRAISSPPPRRPEPVIFMGRAMRDLDALPETPVDPLATAAMHRIESLTERRLRDASSEDQVDLRGLMPADLVQFVRENRPWVVGGGTGLVLLCWIGSAMLSRRSQ
jgi:hypothetical protein